MFDFQNCSYIGSPSHEHEFISIFNNISNEN